MQRRAAVGSLGAAYTATTERGHPYRATVCAHSAHMFRRNRPTTLLGGNRVHNMYCEFVTFAVQFGQVWYPRTIFSVNARRRVLRHRYRGLPGSGLAVVISSVEHHEPVPSKDLAVLGAD